MTDARIAVIGVEACREFQLRYLHAARAVRQRWGKRAAFRETWLRSAWEFRRAAVGAGHWDKMVYIPQQRSRVVRGERQGAYFVARVKLDKVNTRVVVDPMGCSMCGEMWSRLDPPSHKPMCPVLLGYVHA